MKRKKVKGMICSCGTRNHWFNARCITCNKKLGRFWGKKNNNDLKEIREALYEIRM